MAEDIKIWLAQSIYKIKKISRSHLMREKSHKHSNKKNKIGPSKSAAPVWTWLAHSMMTWHIDTRSLTFCLRCSERVHIQQQSVVRISFSWFYLFFGISQAFFCWSFLKLLWNYSKSLLFWQIKEQSRFWIIYLNTKLISAGPTIWSPNSTLLSIWFCCLLIEFITYYVVFLQF